MGPGIASALTDVAGPERVKHAFGRFTQGVVALAALIDDRPEIMIVSTFTVGVSFDPPLASFAADHRSVTWPQLAKARAIGVTALAGEQADVVYQLAGSDRAHRFDAVPWSVGADGEVLLDHGAAWLSCAVEAAHRAGDHDMVLLRVRSHADEPQRRPIVLQRSTLHALDVAS